MDLIYLDYNCFQRRFDDYSQIRIQIEALACQEIFNWAENQTVQLTALRAVTRYSKID
ncbi:MAG: hypothetical protein F6J86_23825 [Symploca sp. SIO1B1]|nr:hypothetical protein [Symploca sp. SIO1B1]